MTAGLYALLVGLGASLGLARVAQRAPEHLRLRLVQAGLVVQAGALVGARLAYVLASPAHFRQNPLDVLRFSLGGLLWPGALVGGLITLLLVTRVVGTSLAETADALQPALAPMLVLTWLAAWSAGAGYGMVVEDAPWWAWPALDEQGLRQARFPLQPLAAFTVIPLAVALDMLAVRVRRAGLSASLAALVFGLHTLVFTLLRADPTPTWNGLAYDLWAALALAAVGVVGCLFFVIRRLFFVKSG